MSQPSQKAKNASVTDKQIGARISQIRLSQGVTRQALAEAIGITHQQLQKYEKGTNRIAASRLVDIANFLNTPVSELFSDLSEGLSEAEINKQRLCMEIMRDFLNIKRKDQQLALRQLIRVLAE